MNRILPFVVLLAACTKDEGETGDTDPAEIVWEDATGNLTCYAPGSAFLTQNVDTAKQVVASGTATVLDFQSDEPVEEAAVQVWYSDDVTTTVDDEGESAADGTVSLDLQVCKAIAYKTAKDPALGETVDTYEAHQIVEPAEPVEVEFNSVSTVTYNIIPSLLGISPTPGLGIIAGTAFDCDDEPIENARVEVRDASGNAIDGVIVKYFVDDFPNRDQPDTSPDGLWVAIDVPPGEVTVVLQTQQGGEVVIAGQTVVQSYPDSINISNIYTGYGDGVKYPASCLVAE
jgi:hypothetical protein